MIVTDLKKDNLKKKTEIYCLKGELKTERKLTCLLEQKIEIMLAEANPPPALSKYES